MRFLLWMAACVLLVLMCVGVGSVMAFVLGGATPVALIVGAGLVVMSFHGLRRIDPTGTAESLDDDWGTAIVVQRSWGRSSSAASSGRRRGSTAYLTEGFRGQ